MSAHSTIKLSADIREKARNLGFDIVGIAPVRSLDEHISKIKEWCSKGMNGDMLYLEQNIERRVNPELVLKDSRSVIVTGLNYFTEKKLASHGSPVISRYAYGEDYHYVIRRKLDLLYKHIECIVPEIKGKVYVDTGPVLEKAWAKEAGLGWPGRNSVLINKDIGSFFFIGIIIVNIDLAYDEPLTEDLCGHCRVCIDSCPTGAINENRTIDVRKCISYITVESKAPMPGDLISKSGGRAFGCDLCQDVCPWNMKAVTHNIPEFCFSEELAEMELKDWQDLSRERFDLLFKNSAITRRTYEKFIRSIEIVTRL